MSARNSTELLSPPSLPGHPTSCHHPASCCLVRGALLQPKLVDTEEEPCGDDPCMRLLLGPHDLRAPNQPPSSVIALTGLGQRFPQLFLRKLGDHSPSKAWKRSLCSTLRREGAHRSRGGARSQRADLGAGEMQGRVGWEKKETGRPMYSPHLPSRGPFTPDSMERFRERDPQSLSPQSTPRSLLHKDSCFSPLGLSDISLFSHFNLPNPPGLKLSCVLPTQF